MSGFYQLMMKRFHSEANYMNLTVVGSPTISSGVVSGFSSLNYLRIANNVTFGNDFEICFKFKITQGSETQAVFNFSNDSEVVRITAQVGTDNIITFILRANDISDQINVQSPNPIVTNKYYYAKFINQNNVGSVLFSEDGTSWQILATHTFTQSFATTKYNYIGNRDLTLARYLRGEIDLNPNSSYIKINNTKYNFQFTMPLTVVGSPTITDGVVSGFSSDDYLTLSTNINLNADFEFVCKLNRLNGSSSAIFCCDTAGQNMFCAINAANIRFYNITFGSLFCYATFSTNTDYFIRLRRTDDVIYLDYSLDGKTFIGTVQQSAVGITMSYIKTFGKAPYQASDAFSGSIDFKNSYVIINGTKYIFTV